MKQLDISFHARSEIVYVGEFDVSAKAEVFDESHPMLELTDYGACGFCGGFDLSQDLHEVRLHLHQANLADAFTPESVLVHNTEYVFLEPVHVCTTSSVASQTNESDTVSNNFAPGNTGSACEVCRVHPSNVLVQQAVCGCPVIKTTTEFGSSPSSLACSSSASPTSFDDGGCGECAARAPERARDSSVPLVPNGAQSSATSHGVLSGGAAGVDWQHVDSRSSPCPSQRGTLGRNRGQYGSDASGSLVGQCGSACSSGVTGPIDVQGSQPYEQGGVAAGGPASRFRPQRPGPEHQCAAVRLLETAGAEAGSSGRSEPDQRPGHDEQGQVAGALHGARHPLGGPHLRPDALVPEGLDSANDPYDSRFEIDDGSEQFFECNDGTEGQGACDEALSDREFTGTSEARDAHLLRNEYAASSPWHGESTTSLSGLSDVYRQHNEASGPALPDPPAEHDLEEESPRRQSLLGMPSVPSLQDHDTARSYGCAAGHEQPGKRGQCSTGGGTSEVGHSGGRARAPTNGGAADGTERPERLQSGICGDPSSAECDSSGERGGADAGTAAAPVPTAARGAARHHAAAAAAAAAASVDGWSCHARGPDADADACAFAARLIGLTQACQLLRMWPNHLAGPHVRRAPRAAKREWNRICAFTKKNVCLGGVLLTHSDAPKSQDSWFPDLGGRSSSKI